MREINFRAWDKNSKEWVEDFILDRLGSYYQTNKCEFWGDDRDLALMQWTGLKDKNGVEIYEGDIINLDNGLNEGIYDVVEWNNEDQKYIPISGMGQNRTRDNELNEWGHMFWKIVGNIYENPELLSSD